ncbi:MAG TPA: hypothetical protein VFC67_24140 [Prolixibacteraceae bacterium]|nr:hypothetical protein [Prolixibacteraceae bacterium]
MKLKAFIRTSLIVVISLTVCNIAFSKGKEVPYLRNGVSFSIAEGWKMIANDSIGDNAYYFSAERTGSKATGLITVTWVNKTEDPEKTMALHQQTMKSANIYRNPGIEFTAVIPDTFASLKVVSCRYTTVVKEQKLEGFIYCFNSSQKTITIFFQTGLDDQKVNEKAFDLIRQTFNCRE